MNKEVKEETSGECINVDIFQPKEGKFPIGRYNGIICKLQLAEGIKFVPYGSTCYCEILETKPKCLIVKVLEVIKSPEINRFEAQQKIDELKQKLDSSKVKKEKKQKRNFPFLSKNEK